MSNIWLLGFTCSGIGLGMMWYHDFLGLVWQIVATVVFIVVVGITNPWLGLGGSYWQKAKTR